MLALGECLYRLLLVWLPSGAALPLRLGADAQALARFSFGSLAHRLGAPRKGPRSQACRTRWTWLLVPRGASRLLSPLPSGVRSGCAGCLLACSAGARCALSRAPLPRAYGLSPRGLAAPVLSLRLGPCGPGLDGLRLSGARGPLGWGPPSPASLGGRESRSATTTGPHPAGGCLVGPLRARWC